MMDGIALKKIRFTPWIKGLQDVGPRRGLRLAVNIIFIQLNIAGVTPLVTDSYHHAEADRAV